MKTTSLNAPFLLILKFMGIINRNFKHKKWFFDGEPKIIHLEETVMRGNSPNAEFIQKIFFLVKKPQICEQKVHILSFWYVCKHWEKIGELWNYVYHKWLPKMEYSCNWCVLSCLTYATSMELQREYANLAKF